MEGGRRRRVAWVAGLLLGLVVLALFLPPLVLRGPVLRWAVARGTDSLCGDFELGGGHVGWATVPNLLLGRTITVEVRDARVRTPDGNAIISVAEVRARVTVGRNPWRITVEDAVASRGGWRLTDGGPPGSRFVDAFRTVPAGGSRAACREPRPKTRDLRERHAFSSGFSLVVRDLRMEEVDAELEFSAWGLKLPRVNAHGSLGIGLPGTGGVLFDARDVTAPSASLRIGRANQSGITRASFDGVAISHVATTAEQPTDIALTVKAGRTGRSVLSGTSRFTNVFRLPGPRASRPPTGIDLDARWSDTADVLARLQAGWLPNGATLETVGLGGTLVARMRGPFKALSGVVTADGPRTHLEATMEEGRRAAVDLRATGIDLAPLLNDSLHPFLAGRASGRLRARVDLAPQLAEMEGSIDEADVSIDRTAKAVGPRRFTLRVGPPAGRVPLSNGDTLAVALERARVHAGAVSLDGWRARWAGIAVGGNVRLALPQPATAERPDPPAMIDATVTATLTSLGRWISPAQIDARGTATAHVTGPFDRLRANVAFGPTTNIAILGERFHAPPTMTAALDGKMLTVSELRFLHDGGGEVATRVHGDLGRDLGGHLEIRSYPLSRIPAFVFIKPPYVLAAPAGASLSDVLEGTVDASFDVRGTLEHPRAAGTATLSGVRVVGRAVPDGRFTVQLAPLHAKVAGSLGPTLSVSGVGNARPNGVQAAADLTFKDFAISPWLPPPLNQLISSVTGQAHVSVEPNRYANAAGTLRVTGQAGDMTFDGKLTTASLEGQVRGQVELAGLRPVWSDAIASADGALEVDLHGTLEFAHIGLDRLAGVVAIARPLRAQLAYAPLVLEAAPGGRITVDGPRLHTDGLAVTTPGARAELRGEVRLDSDAPARSMVALQASGELDAGGIARRVKIPMITSASGTATFEARAEGRASDPALAGQARFVGVDLRPAAAGWPAVRIDGTVEASGHTVSTRGLRIRTAPLGELAIGAPHAPASVDILSFDPARLGRVDVPVEARGLHLGDPTTAFEIGALDLSLRLTGDSRLLALRGDVGVARARFDPKRGTKKAPSGPSRPWYESLPPHLLLDLNLRGNGGAFSVAVPGPDVSVGFDCHVSASRQGATLSGHLRGSTVYSRMALTLYDWFVPQDVRACRVLKER